MYIYRKLYARHVYRHLNGVVVKTIAAPSTAQCNAHIGTIQFTRWPRLFRSLLALVPLIAI